MYRLKVVRTENGLPVCDPVVLHIPSVSSAALVIITNLLVPAPHRTATLATAQDPVYWEVIDFSFRAWMPQLGLQLHEADRTKTWAESQIETFCAAAKRKAVGAAAAILRTGHAHDHHGGRPFPGTVAFERMYADIRPRWRTALKKARHEADAYAEGR